MAENQCNKIDIRRTADELSSRLYILREIAKLAAFAVEARRTLQGVEDVLTFDLEFEELLSQQVEARRNWTTMDDCAGIVMQWVAQEMSRVDDSTTRALYAIADGKEMAHG